MRLAFLSKKKRQGIEANLLVLGFSKKGITRALDECDRAKSYEPLRKYVRPRFRKFMKQIDLDIERDTGASPQELKLKREVANDLAKFLGL